MGLRKILISIFFLMVATFSLYGQVITTVTGGGAGGGLDGWGDGLHCSNAIFGNFCGIAFDKKHNLFIADKDHHIVRKIDAITNIITVVAGNGTQGYSGDAGSATNAQLNFPGWLAFDSHNNLYISDRANHCIRKVDSLGVITTYAGNGVSGFSGDGTAANTASLFAPQGICIDHYDNLYICDNSNHRIRKVDTFGIIGTIAGIGTVGFSGDGGAAINAEFGGIYGICTDKDDNVYIADWNNSRIRKIFFGTNIIKSVSGNGDSFYTGDGVLADSTGSDPFDVSIDDSNNIYIADQSNNRIRKIDTFGFISTVAGTGVGGFSGDGD